MLTLSEIRSRLAPGNARRGVKSFACEPKVSSEYRGCGLGVIVRSGANLEVLSFQEVSAC